MSATERQIRFIHAQLRGISGPAPLSAGERAALIEAGVVAETDGALRLTGMAREWLHRARAAAGARPEKEREPQTEPLPLLGALTRPARGRPPFLAPHHVAAACRVQRLFDRAHLSPRVTMAYSPVAGLSGRRGDTASDITDMAAGARKALADIHKCLPHDCASVVVDVCGYEKGLQTVETERGWPRRSAKLVLRIGLEQLAAQFGLMPLASGPDASRNRGWMDTTARPSAF